MGRSIRITLPTLKENLKPQWPNMEQIKHKDKKAKESYKRFHNRRNSTKPLPPLAPGDRVQLKFETEKAWGTTAVVQNQEPAPRSFTLRGEHGDTLRRNRRHIQLVNREQSTPTQCNRPTELSIDTSDPTSSHSDTGMDHGTGQHEGPVITRFGRVVKPPWSIG